MKGWMFPYFKSECFQGTSSRSLPTSSPNGNAISIVHYCWSYDNRVKGMTEDTAQARNRLARNHAVSLGCAYRREPLLRPDFATKSSTTRQKRISGSTWHERHAFCRPEVTTAWPTRESRLSISPVDTIKEKPGLPKALEHVRSYFDYLVKRQYRYGYTMFFNTNICRTNIEDVKELAKIAHENGILHHLPYQRSAHDGAGSLQHLN